MNNENKQYGNNFIRSMRLFYEEYADDEKWQQLVVKLPWGDIIYY